MSTTMVEQHTHVLGQAVRYTGFDEIAREYYAVDCVGVKHWGATLPEAERRATSASIQTWRHLARNPEDIELIAQDADARDEFQTYLELSHGG